MLQQEAQRRWNRTTVQPFLDVGSTVPNDTLERTFCRPYPGFRPTKGAGLQIDS
jgi:hypothetical protein